MILGAYGKIGRLIAEKAHQQQWEVTAVVHKVHPRIKLQAEDLIVKDVTKLTVQDVENFDIVVDATGGWRSGTENVVYDSVAHLTQLLDDGQTRYIKIGGANTLYINRDHSSQLQTLPSYYPAKYQFLCRVHTKALALLRTYSNIPWTYVTPPVNFIPAGPETGTYQVGAEEFKANLQGDDGINDYISYADFANGVIDLIKQNNYVRQRITLFSGDLPKQDK